MPCRAGSSLLEYSEGGGRKGEKESSFFSVQNCSPQSNERNRSKEEKVSIALLIFLILHHILSPFILLVPLPFPTNIYSTEIGLKRHHIQLDTSCVFNYAQCTLFKLSERLHSTDEGVLYRQEAVREEARLCAVRDQMIQDLQDEGKRVRERETLLHSTLLYCTVLYTVLNSTLLYSTILYYILLQYTNSTLPPFYLLFSPSFSFSVLHCRMFYFAQPFTLIHYPHSLSTHAV